MHKFIKKNGLIILILILILLSWYFGWYKYFSFEVLKQQREQLLLWTSKHFFIVVACYMLIYMGIVAISLPGATFMTVTGGFLFGIVVGSMAAVIAATIGAIILFFAVKLSFRDWFKKRNQKWIKQMEQGFSENDFSYLLTLRLIPLFPFWLVNIVPALLGMKIARFSLATLLGIIPGTVVYVSLGNGLSTLFEQNQTPNMKIIFNPEILIPLIALGLLSLAPIVYKNYKSKKHE